MKIISKLLCVAALAASVPALASPIVLDHSPQATGASVITDYYSNIYNGQFFAGKFSLGSNVALTGMDIYSGSGWGSVGTGATVTVWADKAGLPGSVLAQFGTTITAIDSDGAAAQDLRKHTDFSGFTAQGGETYWIGMAGNGAEITQTGLANATNDDMVVLSGGQAYPMYGVQMAYRLYGDDAAAVPEPASLAIFALGLAGMAALRRQRRG